MTAAAAKTKPNIIKLKPFQSGDLFGRDWTVWKGPADGDGLSGNEERAPEWDAFAEFDLSQIAPVSLLKKGEPYATGNECRKRLLLPEYAGKIRVGPSLAIALRDEPDKFPEAWDGLYPFCDQLVLRSPDGSRDVVYFCRGGRAVDVCYYWLDDDRYADNPSLLASKPSGS